MNDASKPGQSTVAYVARLIIHRYAMLGVLDDEGQPLRQMGVLETPDQPLATRPMAGKPCPECGNPPSSTRTGATSAPAAATWGNAASLWFAP
jgi:ribonucleoside-diphosphate reductase alpha chain